MTPVYLGGFIEFHLNFFPLSQDAVLGVETDRGSNVKSRYLPPHLRGKPGQDGPPPENSYREPNNRDKGISEIYFIICFRTRISKVKVDYTLGWLYL